MNLYSEQFIERDFEREDLFLRLQEAFNISNVLYPGSFVHITPSFVFKKVCYVDTDKRASRFFNNPDIIDFISSRKHYQENPEINFHSADYSKPFGEKNDSFDLLISQYAGFVSQECKQYLKKGGILLANNSHGDAGLASIDEDYKFIGVILHRRGQHKIGTSNLEKYFIPKRKADINKEYLLNLGRGIGYTKTASNYLFMRK